MTATPRVSSRSSVAGMSRMDFTPAETTVIGVLDSTVRSADSSKVSLAPRCTPPSPPVANTRMPARAASTDVAATVVPPVAFLAIAMAMSRLPTLTADSSVAMRSSSPGVRPTLGTPSTRAIVAAVTPWPARMASNSRAASRLPGRGRPWEMIVDSSATTGAPDRSAALTGGDTSTRDGTRTIVSLARHQPVSTPQRPILVTLRYDLPGGAGTFQGPLPRLGDVIRRVRSDRVDRADDDHRAPGGAQADPDHRARSPVRIGAVRVASEDEHVRVRRLVEQHASGQSLGDLGAHADAREQAECLADRAS